MDKQNLVDGLELMTEKDIPQEEGTYCQGLVRHPEYEELIPAHCSYEHNSIRVSIQEKHPGLGKTFAFQAFEKPGLVKIGHRYLQIYNVTD